MGRRSVLVTSLGLILTLILVVTIAAIRQMHPVTASEPAAAYPPPGDSLQTDLLPPTSPSEAYPGPETPTPGVPMPFPTLEPPTPVPTPVPSDAALAAIAYIAGREGIPPEVLLLGSDHPTEYPNLGRRFQVVTLLDPRPGGGTYKLLVDLQSGEIVEDVSVLMAAEEQAKRARYGKLEPALHERLQGLGDDETLPVAIWVAAGPGQSFGELQTKAFQTLVERYPEARAAMEASGMPLDVSDAELRRHIEAEYLALMYASMEERVRPLVNELQSRGYAPEIPSGMPSLTAVLPKRVILELSERADIDTIYLIEEKVRPLLDSAVPTDRVPAVWSRGYEGAAVTIAIVEPGNVDRNNSWLHHASVWRSSSQGVTDHATRVASAAASFHTTYRGGAPAATVLSAGASTAESDNVNALNWAFDQGASLANYSAGSGEDTAMNWLDRAFDYWARLRNRSVVVAASNNDYHHWNLSSPSKAWNVIAVGACDDRGNSLWGDDLMWPDSSYVNPVSTNNDREKPEVAAPGANITALGSPPRRAPRPGPALQLPR